MWCLNRSSISLLTARSCVFFVASTVTPSQAGSLHVTHLGLHHRWASSHVACSASANHLPPSQECVVLQQQGPPQSKPRAGWRQLAPPSSYLVQLAHPVCCFAAGKSGRPQSLCACGRPVSSALLTKAHTRPPAQEEAIWGSQVGLRASCIFD